MRFVFTFLESGALSTLLNSKMPSMYSIHFKRRLGKRISMILKLLESDTNKLQVSFTKRQPADGALIEFRTGGMEEEKR